MPTVVLSGHSHDTMEEYQFDYIWTGADSGCLIGRAEKNKKGHQPCVVGHQCAESYDILVASNGPQRHPRWHFCVISLNRQYQSRPVPG